MNRTQRHSLAADATTAPRAACGQPTTSPWNGKRVTLMGLGRHGGGLGAARYLAERGAAVTISDVADAAQLAESLARLEDVPLAAVKLGLHDPDDFRSADLVVVNPAVRPDHPLLALARESGAALTSETELFLRACPATVIGVTGSNGKSTCCAMLAEVLSAAGRRTWLGGNIGGSLLDDVDLMTTSDWVVLELSSFQLAHLSPGTPMPRYGLVTNCTPNHLDWHGQLAEYVAAKQRLVREQPPQGWTVLDPADRVLAPWRATAAGRLLAPWADQRVPELAVPGRHNRRNAAAVAALAESLGCDVSIVRDTLADFTGLDHRIQFLGEIEGRRFYNDSKSTSPDAARAALAAVPGPIWWLAGGAAKGASFDELAHVAVLTIRGAALYGAARDAVGRSLQQATAACQLHSTPQLADALAWCWRQSQPGDAIVLSPACASHDQFQDFTERGEVFCQLVAQLARGGNSPAAG